MGTIRFVNELSGNADEQFNGIQFKARIAGDPEETTAQGGAIREAAKWLMGLAGCAVAGRGLGAAGVMADKPDPRRRALSARQQRRHHPPQGGAAHRPKARRHAVRRQPAPARTVTSRWRCVKNAAPDGTTFLLGSDIQFSISPNLYAKLPLRRRARFQAGRSAGAHRSGDRVATRSSRANNIPELVALARAEPGKLTYASTGIGSSHQLYMELFKIRNGIDILHVPYRGTGHATPDIISGQVDIMFFGRRRRSPACEGGQIKALGAGSLQRLERLPQVATIAEAGNPDFAANNLWGVWAPAGTPDAHIEKLRRAIMESLADPDIRKFYRDSALTTMDGGADEMMKVITRAARQMARGDQGRQHQADRVTAFDATLIHLEAGLLHDRYPDLHFTREQLGEILRRAGCAARSRSAGSRRAAPRISGFR